MSASRFKADPYNSRLLVVDDLPDNSFLVQSILEDQGYHVDIVDSGAEALARIESVPPDLVLLDVMMPDIDGYEVTRRLRKNTALPFIPILLITAYDQPSVVKGLDLGADDFVRKPVEVDELLARVRSLLRLKRSIDERDFIARQREDFVSRLTHDLRTPLIAADRMLDFMKQESFGPVSEAMKEPLGMLVRNNRNLLDLVNKLLQVYRFEAGVQSLNISDFDLTALTHEIVEDLMPLVLDKGLLFNCEIDPVLPQIQGDRSELRRVIANLIDNSIKYTEQGHVSVRLTPATIATTATPEFIFIKVEDTGCGIPEVQREHLFEPFHPGTHKRAGSGLGLYLSRYIVEAHQGSITVMSTPGQGSCFTICLPVKQRKSNP